MMGNDVGKVERGILYLLCYLRNLPTILKAKGNTLNNKVTQ